MLINFSETPNNKFDENLLSRSRVVTKTDGQTDKAILIGILQGSRYA